MKISSNELRAMILEELKAVRGETLTENEEVDEGVGDYGSPAGRERADDNFDAALETLKQAVQSGRASIEQVLAALRGGAEAGETWHDNINVGRMGEAEEDLDETGCNAAEEVEELDEDEGADEGEEVVEGLSLVDEMEGHIDSALEEEGLQTVQESFSDRRLARLAGILED